MSRCYKVHSYLYKQSNYTKCVSEILEHRLTIIKEYEVTNYENTKKILNEIKLELPDTPDITDIKVNRLSKKRD